MNLRTTGTVISAHGIGSEFSGSFAKKAGNVSPLTFGTTGGFAIAGNNRNGFVAIIDAVVAKTVGRYVIV